MSADKPAQPDAAAPPVAEAVEKKQDDGGGKDAAPANAPQGEAWKSHWEPDDKRTACSVNEAHKFTLTMRKHHCRRCGALVCDSCSMWRLPVPEAPVSPAERACLACVRALVAARLPGLPDPEQLKKHGPVDVPVNKEEAVSGAHIERGEAAQAVTGQANAKIELTDCVVDGGIVKGSNGHVKLLRCVVRGNVALDITGNNKVEMVDCYVEGSLHAVRLAANAKLTARNSVIISTDPATGSVALVLTANAKATLEDCNLAGANGYTGKANSVLTVTGKSTVSCRMSPLGGALTARCAIAGKSDVAASAHVVGPKTVKVAAKPWHSLLDDKF